MGKAWDMEFNPSKCQVVHICRSRRPIKNKYTMHGQFLDSIDHARYVGVDISSDLNFSHHVNRITANASKSLGFLKRNIKPNILEYTRLYIKLHLNFRLNMHHLFGVRTLKWHLYGRGGSEKGHSLDSQLLLSLPKCYGTPTIFEPEDAGTEEGGC